jgi:hypothetical protein
MPLPKRAASNFVVPLRNITPFQCEQWAIKRGGNRHSVNLAWVNQNRVLCADGNDMVSLDPAAGVQKQDCQTFAFRVVIRMGGNVHPPIIGGFVGCIAMLQRFRGRALTTVHILRQQWFWYSQSNDYCRNERTEGQGVI